MGAIDRNRMAGDNTSKKSGMLPDVRGGRGGDYDEAADAYSNGGGDGRNRRGSGASKLQNSPSVASLHG